ncbi:MAG: hypothetical protein ACRCXL_04270 [Dermatophilaceae bacterium]
MSMSVCVLDPSTPPGDVRQWSCGGHRAVIAGRLGGPGVADYLRTTTGGDGHVILLHRPSERDDAGFLANVISGALPGVAIARLEVTTTLLAATMTALEASVVSPDGHVTRLSRIANSLDHVSSGLWVQKATRLTAPNPSFRQHLRSLVPGGPGFVALRSPEPRLVKADAGGCDPSMARGRLVVGAEPDAPGLDRLRAWFGGDTMCVPPAMASVRHGYGDAGFEFAIVDEAVAAPDPARGHCRVCGETLHHPACPFCHVLSDPPLADSSHADADPGDRNGAAVPGSAIGRTDGRHADAHTRMGPADTGHANTRTTDARTANARNATRETSRV